MARKSNTTDLRTTLGILEDDKTTLGIAPRGRPKSISIILQSIESEEVFGILEVFLEEDQTITLVGIESEEAVGGLGYYKYSADTSTQISQLGGDGTIGRYTYEYISKKKTSARKQTVTLGSIESEEVFGDIDTTITVSLKSIYFRENKITTITVDRIFPNDDDDILLFLLAA